MQKGEMQMTREEHNIRFCYATVFKVRIFGRIKWFGFGLK